MNEDKKQIFLKDLAARLQKYLNPETKKFDLDKVLPLFENFTVTGAGHGLGSAEGESLMEFFLGDNVDKAIENPTDENMPMFHSMKQIKTMDELERVFVIAHVLADMKNIIRENIMLNDQLTDLQRDYKVLEESFFQLKSGISSKHTKRLLS